jgi:hypothetical protein
MGIHQPQKELFSYEVHLDRRVRTVHPLRRLQTGGIDHKSDFIRVSGL